MLPANWRSGLASVAEHGVFVAAAVDGWVVAVGPDIGAATADAADVVPPLLERLSRAFGSAVWFATSGDDERHGWAVADDGALRRGYAFAGEHGGVFWHGEVTEDERALECFVEDPRDSSDDEIKWWPDERTVLQLAAAWSFDPSRLGEQGLPTASGWVGRL
ncbi:MAG: hypothetical protein ABIP94_17655 [Planctomycetota bacterium]